MCMGVHVSTVARSLGSGAAARYEFPGVAAKSKDQAKIFCMSLINY